MTREQLEAVHNALTEIIDSWNDAAADEDRGRSNDAICLTLWDDGSGRIGRRSWGMTNEVEDWHEFNDVDGLLSLLKDQGIEFEDSCPKCGGSGGGDEPHLKCRTCDGTGRRKT